MSIAIDFTDKPIEIDNSECFLCKKPHNGEYETIGVGGHLDDYKVFTDLEFMKVSEIRLHSDCADTARYRLYGDNPHY